MSDSDFFHLFTDGCSKGNPGMAAGGILILDSRGDIIISKKIFLGSKKTNNEAEYLTMLEGLITAKKMGIKRIKIFSDSQLVVRQIRGEYKIKKETLKKINKKIMEILESFEEFEINSVPRENKYIKIVDKLANDKIKEIIK